MRSPSRMASIEGQKVPFIKEHEHGTQTLHRDIDLFGLSFDSGLKRQPG